MCFLVPEAQNDTPHRPLTLSTPRTHSSVILGRHLRIETPGESASSRALGTTVAQRRHQTAPPDAGVVTFSLKYINQISSVSCQTLFAKNIAVPSAGLCCCIRTALVARTCCRRDQVKVIKESITKLRATMQRPTSREVTKCVDCHSEQ